MDIIVISLDPAFDLQLLQRMFPGNVVQIQQGVDVRTSSPLNLYRCGLIGVLGYYNLTRGRKWHHELNSLGGVGLANANVLALEKSSAPLLLLEDDFVVRDALTLHNSVNTLRMHDSSFDIAVFGPHNVLDRKLTERVSFMPDGWYWLPPGAIFHGLHCCFYSANGRARTHTYLKKLPIDMQLDSVYSMLVELEGFRIMVQVPGVVKQSFHLSSIQTDWCVLCHISPKQVDSVMRHHKYSALVVAALLVALVAVGVSRSRRTTTY